MPKEKIRNSNHELMRIISMFLIVLGHVILKGAVLKTTNPNLKTFYTIVILALIVHVNSYLLLTGYYQSKSSFKQQKVWSILNANWFYRVIIVSIFLGFNLINVTKIQLLKDISYLPRDYWFITCYVMLYLLSPFLNKLIKSLNHKEYKYLIILSTILFCFLPTFTNEEVFSNNGYTLYNCIYFYFIGAYLRIYPVDKCFIFKKNSKSLYRLILISIFILCILFNFLLSNYSKEIIGYNSFFEYIAKIIDNSFIHYNNPLIVIQSISYFLFFTSLNFKSKLINSYSKLMLGIYMIHEQHYLREELYKWLGIIDGPRDTYKFILYVFAMALFIFITCSIIEWIRQILFKFIYNRKLATKLREKYYNWLKEITKHNDMIN